MGVTVHFSKFVSFEKKTRPGLFLVYTQEKIFLPTFGATMAHSGNVRVGSWREELAANIFRQDRLKKRNS